MPVFAFQGARDDGRIEAGILDAADRAAAMAQVKARGLTPVSISPQTEPSTSATIAKLVASAIPRRSRLDERAALFRAVSPLLNAGIRPERAVALAAQMVAQKSLRSATRQWVEDMRSGRSLAAAMARTPELIPPTMSQAIAAAEIGGMLNQTVEKIASSTQNAQALRNRVVSALAYPVLLLVTMIGVLALLFTSVIPSLKPLFAQAGAAMPWPAAILVAVADVTQSYG